MRTSAIPALLVAGLVAGIGLSARAAQPAGGAITLHVVDRDGQPVKQVAVYAVPRGGARPDPVGSTEMRAVMDQRHHAFVPHILVIRTGTKVEFPNNDEVSHHVYSFSPAKSFELALYKQGTVHPPLLFDTPGVVTLGCNIHDDMVGYILVVDTAHFGLTDSGGSVTLGGLAPGLYRVHIWTPRMRPAALPEPAELSVSPGRPQTLAVHFTRKLYPAHDDGETTLTWTDY